MDAKNLFNNPGAEEVTGELPANWRVRTYTGEAKHSVAASGHSGAHSFLIESASGADTSFHFDLDLEPGHDYLLSGWIKTENLKTKGDGKGGLVPLSQKIRS